MRIALLSNYFNHHQKPLSDKLSELCEEFFFISTLPMEQERIDMGWGEKNTPNYVIDYLNNKLKCEKIISTFDIVIYGAAPYDLIKSRLVNNQLVLIYSERIFKKGIFYWKNIWRIPRIIKHFAKYENTYLLAASAYAYSDYYFINCFRGRCLKWGYFPVTYKYEDVEKIIDLKQPTSILWVARFIELKHPELCIELARRLQVSGRKFNITMIGTGPLREAIINKIKRYNLNGKVKILDSMKPDQVRKHMEKAAIFIFTSDKNEGWGAVLNEAMNSGCSVVASSSIGSAPFLIQDNVNGLLFHSGNADDLFKKVVYLLENPSLRKEMGINAFYTILNQWNADNAASRLVRLFSKEPFLPFDDDGPCSEAVLVKSE